VPIGFTLGPLRNRDYGSVNYRGREIPAANFIVELFDSKGQLVEKQSVASPPIRPAWMGVTATLDTNRSATWATLTLQFMLHTSFLSADEIFVFLPKSHSVRKDLVVAHFSMFNASGKHVILPDAAVQLERVQDPVIRVMERVAIRIGAKRPLLKGINITLSIHNVFTPVGGTRLKDTMYIVSTASYGCSAANAKDMSWKTDEPALLL